MKCGLGTWQMSVLLNDMGRGGGGGGGGRGTQTSIARVPVSVEAYYTIHKYFQTSGTSARSVAPYSQRVPSSGWAVCMQTTQDSRSSGCDTKP